MAYSDFTLAEVVRRFGLTVDEPVDRFGGIPVVDLPPLLAAHLERVVPAGASLLTEKARSEVLIAPILGELKYSNPDRVGLFSGATFDVDPEAGLNGRCDFLLTRHPSYLQIIAPVCVAVEAKFENILAGIPQCIAEMIAAQRFNGNDGEVFGVVTSGTQWRFLRLAGRTAEVDQVEYPVTNARKIYGILTHMVLG